MQLTRHQKAPLYIVLGLIALVTSIGLWWLSIILKMGDKLQQLGGADSGMGKMVRMMKWEGSTFLLILAALVVYAFFYHLREEKKAKAMQAFFASLTHELKTPLASMRLQAEVIQDSAHSLDPARLQELLRRLIEDAGTLEVELDKILQLSRVERKAELECQKISLTHFFQQIQDKFPQMEIEFPDKELYFLADPFALTLIIRNFLQNTARHCPLEKPHFQLQARKDDSFLEIIYSDGGGVFEGEIKKLGDLFYKYKSTKGSGIGLYLVKQLMKSMKGELRIDNHDQLLFVLRFKTIGGLT